MNKTDLRIMQINNRIILLKSRAGCENGNIIKKLERERRNILKKVSK